MIHTTRSREELLDLAHRIALSIVPGETARVIALSGELGAGKTTFAQGFAAALGVTETVSSPTFVIEKVYELSGIQFRRLIHIDAYRLEDSRELGALGWDEITADPGNMILLEWPERIPGLVPVDAIRIRFDIDEGGRIITIDGGKENS